MGYYAMDHEYIIPLTRLGAAMLVGALVGLERTFNGRAAGFRTHTLVATASSLLMLFTVFQFDLFHDVPSEVLRADPTRMAQGIMTGIGFLGAGVIVREGITVRGLTTAASIWMTASIGILIGVGFYSAAAIASVMTLGTLSLFRLLESFIPRLYYARLTARFPPDSYISQERLQSHIAAYHIGVSNVSYALEEDGRIFQYGMTLRTRDTRNFTTLAEGLREFGGLQEFSIIPTWE